MSKKIVVTGLPQNVKFMKTIVFLKHIFNTTDIAGQFWIRELSDDEHVPNKKKMLIDFDRTQDALQAVKRLNNAFFLDHGKHFLRAHLYDGNNDTSEFQEEQIQMQMELLKTQSLVIEEEKRLLLEKKKLEIMKQNSGHSVPHGRVERDLEQHSRAPLQFVRPKRPMIGLVDQALPCIVLYGQVKRHVAQMAIKKEKSMLGRLVRSAIRERLSMLLTKKIYKSTQEIVDLYREQYPVSKDVEFIQGLIVKLKNSFFPRLSHNKAYKKAINMKTEDIVDEVKTEAGVSSSASDMQVDLKHSQNDEKMSEKAGDTDNEMKKEFAVDLKSPTDSEQVDVKTE